MNRDNFWNDERVKEFILSECNKYNTWDEDGLNIWIEKFKSSHSIGNEEWEIESYVTDSFGIKGEVFVHAADDYFKSIFSEKGILPEDVLIHNKATIHSVLRKSDGVVFSINDAIEYCAGDGFTGNVYRGIIAKIYEAKTSKGDLSFEILGNIPEDNAIKFIENIRKPLPQRTKPPLGPLSREVEKLEERIAYIEKKLNIEG